MGLLYVHYGVGIWDIPQLFGPNAIQRTGHSNKPVLREHFRVDKIRAGGYETSGTLFVRKWFSIRTQWQRADVDRAAVGFVDNIDDSPAPDDDGSTRAFGVGLDLTQAEDLRLLPKIF